MNLDKLIFEMYNEVMFSIENNLFEERLSSKESFRRAIALWKNINPAKKEVEAKRILKAAKREGYTIKQKEILAYADEDISSMKAKKSVRRDLRAKKKAKRDERFEQVKANVSDDEDIEDKTRIELLAIAIKKGLKTTPKMNRNDLIDLIQGDEKEVKPAKSNNNSILDKLDKAKVKDIPIDKGVYNEISMFVDEQEDKVELYKKANDVMLKQFPKLKGYKSDDYFKAMRNGEFDYGIYYNFNKFIKDNINSIESTREYAITETIAKINKFYKTDISNYEYTKGNKFKGEDIKENVKNLIADIVDKNPDLDRAGFENIQKELKFISEYNWQEPEEVDASIKNNKIKIKHPKYSFNKRQAVEGAIEKFISKQPNKTSVEPTVNYFQNGNLEITFDSNKQALDFYNWVGFKHKE
jgi:hypothetical protein